MAFKQEVATLFLSLRANATAWKAGLKEASNEVSKFKRKIDVDLTSIRSLVTGGALLFETRNIVQAGIAFERMGNGMRAATGSAEQAAAELAFVRAESQRLGLDLQSASQGFTQLTASARGTASQGQVTRDIFSAISEAATVMGSSAEETEGMLRAIAQMMSKGKVSAEELRGQLGERLPGAFNLAAKAIGVTTAELDEMLKKGEVTTDEMLPGLAREIRAAFGQGVQGAINSTQANFNRMTTAIFDLRKEFADEFLPSLTRGIQWLTNTGIPALAYSLEQLGVIRRDIASLSEGEARLRLEDINKTLPKLIKGYTDSDLMYPGEENDKKQKENAKQINALMKEREEIQRRIAVWDENNRRTVMGLPPKSTAQPPAAPPGGGGGEGGGSDGASARAKRLASELKESQRLMDQQIREEQKMWERRDRQAREAMEQFQAELEEEQQRLDGIARERESLLAQIRTPVEEYALSVREFTEAFRRGLVTQEELGKLVDNARKTYSDSLDGMKDDTKAALEEIRDAVQGIGNELTSAITGYLTQTGGSVKDILKSIEVEITQFAVRKTITKPFTELMTKVMSGFGGAGGGAGGGIGSFLSGIFGSLFGGARASGGRVQKGKGYLVGENGPEPFFPDTSGTVMPNKAMGGSSRPVNVNVSFAEIPRTAQQIQSAGQQAARVGLEVRRAMARNT